MLVMLTIGCSPQLDLAAALERCSGSLDLLQQVVSETLHKAKSEQLPEIRKAVEESDGKTAHFHSHSIKGASATIGFVGLSASAKELDDLVRTGTVEGALPLVDALEQELSGSCTCWSAHEAAMASALERCSGDSELLLEIAKEMSSEVVPDQLQSLKAALKEGSAEQVNTTAVQLKDAAEAIGAAQLLSLLQPLLDASGRGSLEGGDAIVDSIQTEVENVAAFWSIVDADED